MSIAAVYINRDTRLVLSRWRRLIGIKPSAKKFQIIFYPLYLIPTVLNAFKLTYVTPALPRPPLPKSFFDFDAKTVLIQEPYALPSFSSVVANVPPCFSSYHQSLMTMFTGLRVELTMKTGPFRRSFIYLRPIFIISLIRSLQFLRFFLVLSTLSALTLTPSPSFKIACWVTSEPPNLSPCWPILNWT
jgi:hypothetical protein